MRPVYFYFVVFSSALVSCVSSGKFKAMEQHAQQSDSLYTWSQRTLKSCQDANNDLVKQKLALQAQTNEMNQQLTATKENNTQMRKQLQTLSALSSAQSEIIKKSLDNMGAKDTYLRALQSALSRRDSANLATLMYLKAAMGNFGEQDVRIKLEKGTVTVDLSDKLLFSSDSNSYVVSDKAKGVLSRLARMLNDQPELEFVVEGHTDSVSYPTDVLPDNWDLSVKRATSVVRILQNEYHVSPIRMTAAGRGEYVTLAANDTPEGQAANRRTRIIILPQLDPLLKLLERRQGQAEAAEPAASTSTISGSN